jgi:signal peptidase
VSAPAFLRRLPTIAFLVVAAFWLVFLRPTVLGGETTYVLVRGDSMLPTYENADLVVARPGFEYAAGEIVVYRIPAGEPGAGQLIVHRIVSGDADTGFTTQGDNNDYTDIWHPRSSDIVGSPAAVVPRAGVVIELLRRPLVPASLAAAFVLLWLFLSPRPPVRREPVKA